MSLDVAQEWNRRILRWERARYSTLAALNPFAWTVRGRASLAVQTLFRQVRSGDSLLELGCGSGILAQRILSLPFSRYTGRDSSPLAVEAARRRFSRAAGGSRCSFDLSDVRTDLREVEADLVFFFGLTDWLNPSEIESLLGRIRARVLVISYTEAEAGLSIPFYRLYQRLAPRKTPREFPRCYAGTELAAIFSRNGWTARESHRGGSLDPGRILVLHRG